MASLFGKKNNDFGSENDANNYPTSIEPNSGNRYLPRYDYITKNLNERYGDHNNVRNQSLDAFRKAEDSSSVLNKEESIDGGMQDARNAERNISSVAKNENFTNNVKGDKEVNTESTFKNLVRKLAPLLVSGGGIAGFGALSFLGQLSMPFSLMAQLQGNFDSIGTSTHMRTSSFFKYQSNPASRNGLGYDVKDFVNQHSTLYKTFTGNTDDYFKISQRQIKKFQSAGIGVEIDGSTGQQVLKYRQPNGEVATIVPDRSMANGVDRVYINDFYESNQGFRTSYSNGARTWRGSVGAWYDKMANKFLEFFGVHRGVWNSYRKGGDSDENLAKYRTTIEDNADGKMSGKASTAEMKENTDSDTDEGNGTYTKAGSSDDSLSLQKGSNREAVGNAAKTFVNSKVTKLLNATGMASGLVCMAADVVGAINLIVIAYQTTQVVKVASSIFEGIQKAQVADSSTSPINEIGNSLIAPITMEYELTDYNNTTEQTGDTGSIATKNVTSNKSAMESAGIQALYGNFATNTKDPSVQSFNITNSINGIMKALGSSITAYRACTFAKLGAAAVQGAVQAAEIIGCIATAGFGCLIDALVEAGREIAKDVAIALVSSIVISAVVPFVANILMRKIATDVMGEDLGNALVSGANIYMGQNHQYSGGSVASKESLTRFIAAREEYNADIARYERENRSPLDYTSQYTFAGSLINKTMPVIISGGSIVSKISSFGNVVGKAFSSLMPGANAVSAAVTAQEAASATDANCPNLADVGAVGDAFCNPYIITDIGTTDLDPAEVVYKVSQLDSRNFDTSSTNTDVPVIKEKSRLGNYIKYCGQRQSPFGLADQNIANEFMDISTGTTVGDSLIGAIPIIGSMVDIYNNSSVIANYGYVSGESCVTGNATVVNKEGDYRTEETSEWTENKYYQRFIEDQRLAENMGLVEKSSVTAFLEDYYEEHPIDNSYEGVLARRSGLTKDQVIATLNIMEAMAFMEGYNPDGYYPLNYSEPGAAQVSFEDVYQKNMDRGFISSDMRNGFMEDRKIKNFAV